MSYVSVRFSKLCIFRLRLHTFQLSGPTIEYCHYLEMTPSNWLRKESATEQTMRALP